MRISIIIPVYKDKSNLQSLLISLDELRNVHEIIVIDGSVESPSLNNDSDIIYLCEKDKGIYDAMNKGVLLAKGEYVYFCGVDDRIDVSTFLSLSEESVDCDLVLGKVMYPSGNRRRGKFNSRMYFYNSVHHQGCLYKRDVFDKYKFNTELRIGADYEMNLFLYLSGSSVVYVDRIFARVGMEGVSNSSGSLGYYEEMQTRRNILKNKCILYLLNLFTYIIKIKLKISLAK